MFLRCVASGGVAAARDWPLQSLFYYFILLFYFILIFFERAPSCRVFRCAHSASDALLSYAAQKAASLSTQCFASLDLLRIHSLPLQLERHDD
jgi:hypothetical protein